MHPYSVKVIVAIIYPGCTDLMSKQTELDDDDYIILMPLWKGEVDDVSGHLCEH